MAEGDSGRSEDGGQGWFWERDERRGGITTEAIEKKPAGLVSGSADVDEEEVLGCVEFEAEGEKEGGAEGGAPGAGYGGEAGVARSRDSGDAEDGEIVGKRWYQARYAGWWRRRRPRRRRRTVHWSGIDWVSNFDPLARKS